MRLIIVRHGESEWNRIGRYQGQQDTPLSELGARQAEALARRLTHEPIDIIFASPLQRAAKTAQAIARHHTDVPFTLEPALLEFKDRLCSDYHGRNVLISTHDVVVKILVADALGMNMDRINRIWVTNASISVIEYGDDLPYLVSLSEACHLGRLESVREHQKAL